MLDIEPLLAPNISKDDFINHISQCSIGFTVNSNTGKSYLLSEPLLRISVRQYLEEHEDFVSSWLQEELNFVLQNKDSMEEKKGIIFEQFILSLLIQISKDLNGAAITSNPIFAQYKGTWLENYTLRVVTADFCAPQDLYKVCVCLSIFWIKFISIFTTTRHGCI